jgi:hypothetical protein
VSGILLGIRQEVGVPTERGRQPVVDGERAVVLRVPLNILVLISMVL